MSTATPAAPAAEFKPNAMTTAQTAPTGPIFESMLGISQISNMN